MLNRLAREFAAEIASHDWSDAPYRLDRAGHQRRRDSRRTAESLNDQETDRLRANVMWVTAQVLKHADPNLDLHEYAAACGVPRSITHRTDGSRSGAITYGLRWDDAEATLAATPGAPMWRAQAQCEVANLVVFKRLLGQIDGLDPSLPPPEVESVGGTTRVVTLLVRQWDEIAAGERAVEMVGAASLAVRDGSAAVLLHVEPAWLDSLNSGNNA